MVDVTCKSREGKWVDAHKDDYFTARDIERKYKVGRNTLYKILPEPDLVSPFSNRTKLWRKEVIEKFFLERALS